MGNKLLSSIQGSLMETISKSCTGKDATHDSQFCIMSRIPLTPTFRAIDFEGCSNQCTGLYCPEAPASYMCMGWAGWAGLSVWHLDRSTLCSIVSCPTKVFAVASSVRRWRSQKVPFLADSEVRSFMHMCVSQRLD